MQYGLQLSQTECVSAFGVSFLARSAFAFSILLSGLLATVFAADPASPTGQDFFIGGYGNGIYVSKYHAADGSMDPPTLACEVMNPSYLCQHPKKPVIYAVCKMNRKGKPTDSSKIVAFKWDPISRKLDYLSESDIQGEGPCYVAVDEEGMFAFVANYAGGSACVFAIGSDGSIKNQLDHVQHPTIEQAGIMKKPRGHCIQMDPTNRWTLVADLGLDRVFVYRFDVDHGKLMRNPSYEGLQTKPGAGPRQIAFHPSGKFLFVINELNSTLTAASWNDETGILKELSTVPTLPADFQEKNSTAAVHVSRDGKTVYGSNRGHDSIAIYRFDDQSGALKLLGHQSTEGKTPRDFKLTPDGRFLLAENQNSDSIVALAIDEKTGMLTPTGKRIDVPKPSCIEFLKTTP
jgi:6-phosphogluconolactonase